MAIQKKGTQNDVTVVGHGDPEKYPPVFTFDDNPILIPDREAGLTVGSQNRCTANAYISRAKRNLSPNS
jgi:hypothetical protein